MSLFPSVRNVRELKRGVQADVVIGESPTHGVVTVQVTSTDRVVLECLERLKEAMAAEADTAIRSAQADQHRRGEVALGA